MSIIDGLPVGDVGLGALVTLVILMLLTGRLVPRRSLDDQREDTKAWRSVSENNTATLVELKAAVKESVELGRTTEHILREIQGARRPTSAEGDVA